MFLNKGRVHLYLRGICVFTLICFSTTTVAWGMPALSTEYGVRHSEIAPTVSLAETIAIPDDIGRIQAAYIAPALTDPVSHASSAAPVIIHIQEAHGQAEAQENIERILAYLKKQYDFKTVFLEGAWGKLDPENLHFFNDAKSNRELLEALDRAGLIGGVELFLAQDEANTVKDENGPKAQTAPAVRHASSGAGYGVEDLELYRQNLEQFRKVYLAKSVTDAYLEELRVKIVDESAKIFNPELKAFFREWAFRTEVADQPFAGFEQLCKTAGKHLALDLSDAREQYDWPQLVRFVKLQAFEKTQDKEPAVKYDAEKQRFSEWLDQSGLDREFKTYFTELLGKGPRALQTPRPSESVRSVTERFYAAALPKGFRFEDYPALTRRIGAAVLSSELQPPDLFKETEKLNDLILAKLAGTEAERALIGQYRQYRLLKKLFSLALTRDEYEGLASNKTYGMRGNVAVQGDAVLHAPPAVQGLYGLAMDFYTTAQKREQVMFEKMLEQMRSLKEPNAVLVTGGFHSGGFSEFFKRHHISYVNVSPRITKLQPQEEYLSLMTQDMSSVKGTGHRVLPELSRSNLRQPTLIMGPELQKLGDLSGPVLRKFREVFQRVSSRNPVLAQKNDPTGLLRRVSFLKNEKPIGIPAVPGAVIRSETRFSRSVSQASSAVSITNNSQYRNLYNYDPRWDHPVFRVASDLINRVTAVLLILPALFISIVPVITAWIISRTYLGKAKVLYDQKRIGYQGKEFTIYKFRTIVHDQYISHNPFPWVRSLGMDELPQLWNVIKGDMTLWGGRPLMRSELESKPVLKPKYLEYMKHRKPGMMSPRSLSLHLQKIFFGPEIHSISMETSSLQSPFKARSEVRNYPPDVVVYPPEETRAELLVYEAPSEQFQFDQVRHSAEWGDTQYRSVKDMPYPTKVPWEMLEAPVRAFWEKEGGTVAVISSGNLFHNDFFVAYRGNGQILYRSKNEPFQDRTYTMFTVWNRPRDGGRTVSAEKLRFKISQTDPKRVEVYLASDTAMKNELSSEIKFAVFGQQLIDHTRGDNPAEWAIPLEEFAYQFGDPFQLFDYPQLKKVEGDGTIYGEGVGKNEAYEGPKHPLKAMDRATLTGIVRDDGYMEIGLKNYQERSYRETYTIERIEKEALIVRGYAAVTPRDKKDLKEGEYFIDAENRLHIRLRRTRYPHDLVGVTRSGKMVSIVLTGNKHRGAGYTIEEAKDAVMDLNHPGLEGDPITDVFLLANSIDAFKRVNGRFVTLFQEAENGQKKFEPYPSGSAAIAFLTPRQHPASEADEKRSEVRGGETADLSALGRLRDHFKTPQRIFWLHENKDEKGRPLGVETVEVLVQYDEFSDVFDVVPTPFMRQRYGPELKMLDMPAAQEQIGISGSFGMIKVVQQSVNGEEAIVFDEIHPSRGFRKLKPARMLRLFKPWPEASISEMVKVLNNAGVRRFYASHPDRIKARYAKFRMPIPEANLAMNYVLPFQDKGWEPVEADVPPDGKTLVWHLKEAGIAAIEAKSKARALRLDALREKSYERMRGRFAKAGFFLTDVRYIFPQYIIGLGEMYHWTSEHTRAVNFRVASIHVPKEYFAEEKEDHVFTSAEAIAMIISEICKNTDHIDVDDQAFIGAKLNLEKDLLEITYYDDGIGNPEAVKRFGEVYSTSGRPNRGYGLRLIKYLTEAFGGHVDFHSNPRYGHYLRILIPIIRPEAPASGEAPALNSKPGPDEGKRAEVRDGALPAAETKAVLVHTGDQHDEAYTWFKEQIDLGHIPKGLPLVLFDSHSDVYSDRALNHTNWVYHLLKERYISRVLWVVPAWAKDLPGDNRAIYEQVANHAREILAKHGIPASSFSWCFLDQIPSVNAQALVSMDYDFFSRDEDMIYRASEEEIRDLAGVVFKQLDDQQVRVAAFDLTRSGEPYTYPDQVPLIETILNASVRDRIKTPGALPSNASNRAEMRETPAEVIRAAIASGRLGLSMSSFPEVDPAQSSEEIFREWQAGDSEDKGIEKIRHQTKLVAAEELFLNFRKDFEAIKAKLEHDLQHGALTPENKTAFIQWDQNHLRPLVPSAAIAGEFPRPLVPGVLLDLIDAVEEAFWWDLKVERILEGGIKIIEVNGPQKGEEWQRDENTKETMDGLAVVMSHENITASRTVLHGLLALSEAFPDICRPKTRALFLKLLGTPLFKRNIILRDDLLGHLAESFYGPELITLFRQELLEYPGGGTLHAAARALLRRFDEQGVEAFLIDYVKKCFFQSMEVISFLIRERSWDKIPQETRQRILFYSDASEEEWIASGVAHRGISQALQKKIARIRHDLEDPAHGRSRVLFETEDFTVRPVRDLQEFDLISKLDSNFDFAGAFFNETLFVLVSKATERVVGAFRASFEDLNGEDPRPWHLLEQFYVVGLKDPGAIKEAYETMVAGGFKAVESRLGRFPLLASVQLDDYFAYTGSTVFAGMDVKHFFDKPGFMKKYLSKRSEVRDLTPGDRKESREISGDLPPAAESWAKAVVFDIGNVIVRTHFLKVGKAFVRAGAAGFSAANLALLLPTLFQNSEFERGQMSARQFFGFLKRNLKLQLSFEDFLRIWADIFEPIPETVELIKQIRKAGYKVFFLSDANPVHIGHFKKTFPEVFFLADRVYTSYELKARKAEGTVIFERMGKSIAKRFGIPLSAMVFLDDRQFNVDHSNKAGLKAVLFTHATRAKGDLRKILSRRSEVREVQDEKKPVEWNEKIQNAVLAYFDLADLPTRQLIAILVQATALNEPARLVQMRLHPSGYQNPREVVHREMVNFLGNFPAMRRMIAEADPENRAELEAEYGPVADGLEKIVDDARSEIRSPRSLAPVVEEKVKGWLKIVRKMARAVWRGLLIPYDLVILYLQIEKITRHSETPIRPAHKNTLLKRVLFRELRLSGRKVEVLSDLSQETDKVAGYIDENIADLVFVPDSGDVVQPVKGDRKKGRQVLRRNAKAVVFLPDTGEAVLMRSPDKDPENQKVKAFGGMVEAETGKMAGDPYEATIRTELLQELNFKKIFGKDYQLQGKLIPAGKPGEFNDGRKWEPRRTAFYVYVPSLDEVRVIREFQASLDRESSQDHGGLVKRLKAERREGNGQGEVSKIVTLPVGQLLDSAVLSGQNPSASLEKILEDRRAIQAILDTASRSESRDSFEYFLAQAKELKIVLGAMSEAEVLAMIDTYLKTYSYQSRAIVSSLKGLLAYGLPAPIATFFASRVIFDKTEQSNILSALQVLYLVKPETPPLGAQNKVPMPKIPAKAIVAKDKRLGIVVDPHQMKMTPEAQTLVADKMIALAKESFSGFQQTPSTEGQYTARLSGGHVLLLVSPERELTGVVWAVTSEASSFSELKNLFTKQDNVRGRGTLLLELYLRDLQKKGVQSVVWESRTDKARDFYLDFLDARKGGDLVEDYTQLNGSFSVTLNTGDRPRAEVRDGMQALEQGSTGELSHELWETVSREELLSLGSDLHQWFDAHGGSSWATQSPRYQDVRARAAAYTLYNIFRIEITADEAWARSFPELKSLQGNEGDGTPGPGAFGQIVLLPYRRGDKLMLLIKEVQPGDGYRHIPQRFRKHLDEWRSRLIGKLVPWAQERNISVIGSSESVIRTLYPGLSEQEITNNYTKVFQNREQVMMTVPLTDRFRGTGGQWQAYPWYVVLHETGEKKLNPASNSGRTEALPENRFEAPLPKPGAGFSDQRHAGEGEKRSELRPSGEPADALSSVPSELIAPEAQTADPGQRVSSSQSRVLPITKDGAAPSLDGEVKRRSLEGTFTGKEKDFAQKVTACILRADKVEQFTRDAWEFFWKAWMPAAYAKQAETDYAPLFEKVSAEAGTPVTVIFDKVPDLATPVLQAMAQFVARNRFIPFLFVLHGADPSGTIKFKKDFEAAVLRKAGKAITVRVADDAASIPELISVNTPEKALVYDMRADGGQALTRLEPGLRQHGVFERTMRVYDPADGDQKPADFFATLKEFFGQKEIKTRVQSALDIFSKDLEMQAAAKQILERAA